jgi:hypothetical protein
MLSVLSGAIMMAYFVSGLFFLRFWKETRDRLFALFSAAFFLLALNYFVLPPSAQVDESLPLHYTVRFFGFLIILLGILDKNYSKKQH